MIVQKKKKEKTARVAVFLCLHEDFTSVFRALSNINVGAFCKIFKLTIFTKTSIVVYDRSLIGPSNIWTNLAIYKKNWHIKKKMQD